MLRVNVTDRIGGYDILDHIFRIMDKGTPPPDDIPAFDMVSIDTNSGLLFLMDEGDLPERSTWMKLKGSTLSQKIWDHGGQLLENAFIHETERGRKSIGSARIKIETTDIPETCYFPDLNFAIQHTITLNIIITI